MQTTFRLVASVGLLSASSACVDSADRTVSDSYHFSTPIRLKAGDEYIATESPGYACPCWYDTDGDGSKDLIVGQFSGGKMRVYRNLGDGKLAEGQWLEADGEIAEVPGVW